MKTVLTTIFAFAFMVFAFNTNPAMAGGAIGIFGWNKSVDEVEDPDETQVARGYVPDCRWKWQLDANTGNWGWVCNYKNEGETPGDNVASWDDDEKADQYGDDWFNSENDDRELACSGADAIYGCSNESSGKGIQVAESDWENWDRENWIFKHFDPFGNESEGEGTEVANNTPLTRREKQAQDEADWNAWILQQFAGLRPGQQDALENDEDWSSWVQQQFAGYMDYCRRSGNCMMNEENKNLEYANLSDFLDRDRKDYNDYKKSLKAFAYGCKSNPDGSRHCPGDAWNSDYPDSESSDGFGGRDIADSGDEGSTSAAGAGDQ